MDECGSYEVGSGTRLFAAAMFVVLVSVGSYGIFRAFNEGPWYLAILAIAAIIYGSLWGNVARTGRHSRIPLWL